MISIIQTRRTTAKEAEPDRGQVSVSLAALTVSIGNASSAGVTRDADGMGKTQDTPSDKGKAEQLQGFYC